MHLDLEVYTLKIIPLYYLSGVPVYLGIDPPGTSSCPPHVDDSRRKRNGV